jgi:GAF domain-containing protein
MPAEQTRHWLRNNALQAIEVARMFGATAIIEYLPIPAACEIKLDQDEPQPGTPYPVPDTLLQLSILRDLSRMLEQQPNINLILETILEGIYRGVGMDRSLFALLTPDKQQIRGKYALGDNNQQLTRRFQFALHNNAFFTWLFRQPDMIWVKDSQDPQQQPAVPAELREAVAVRGFFIYPLILQNKPIGIIYADRQPSRRELDKESCESFRHFCLQARMSIEYVSQGKR